MNSKKEIMEEINNNRNLVGYDTVDWPIGYIKSQFDAARLYVPTYQRSFVWNSTIKSKFIESIFMGLPIPFLFLYRHKETGTLEIVDGAQRIQTLVEFLNNKLILNDLKKLKSLNGKIFNDIPEKYQVIFETTSLRIIVLDEKTTENNRKEIFNRLNTTGEKLEEIEVILGSYSGPFINFLKNCSENQILKNLCPISKEKLKRKENIELVLRFFAYANDLEINNENIVTLKTYSGTVFPFLEKYVKETTTFNKKELESDFINMLTFVKNYFPLGFKKSKKSNSTPRTRFEAIALGVHLALKQNPNLTPNNINWLDDEDFKKVTTTDSANNKSKVIERIQYVTTKLLEAK